MTNKYVSESVFKSLENQDQGWFQPAEPLPPTIFAPSRRACSAEPARVSTTMFRDYVRPCFDHTLTLYSTFFRLCVDLTL